MVSTIARKGTLSLEESRLQQLYQTLLLEKDSPRIEDFSLYGNLADIAREMVNEKTRGGDIGLKRYILSLENLTHESFKRIVWILSSESQDQMPRVPNIEIVHDEQLYPPLPEELAIPKDQTKGLCPLKDEYVRYSMEKSPEGFEEFHSSCFWAMLSTVAGRRVVIDLARRQYTPLIVMLAARSTLYVKTDTAEVERDVLKACGLDWLLGLTRTTPQKLLLDMTGPIPENYSELDYDTQETLRRRLAMSGQRGWHFNEFGKLIKSMMRSSGPMSDFVEILLQISDCPDDLPTGTISRGNETIIKPYLSMTGTLTPASIKAVAGRNAELWSDGFFARMLFSCPPPNSYIDNPFKRGHIPVPSELIKGVRQWHDRLGEPEIDISPIRSEDGKETGRYQKTWIKTLPETLYRMDDTAYEAWSRYRSALKSMTTQFHNTDFDGSYGRLSMMALRVAALAASVNGASQIQRYHWALGQEQAEMWRKSLHQLYAQVNSDDIASSGPTLEDVLAEYLMTLGKSTTAREIVQYGPTQLRKLKSGGVRDILTQLVKDGLVEKEYQPGSKAEWYRRI